MVGLTSDGEPMRFCPFCAQELDDAASECSACGKRLPPKTTGATPLPSAPSQPPPPVPPGPSFGDEANKGPAAAGPASAASAAPPPPPPPPPSAPQPAKKTVFGFQAPSIVPPPTTPRAPAPPPRQTQTPPPPVAPPVELPEGPAPAPGDELSSDTVRQAAPPEMSDEAATEEQPAINDEILVPPPLALSLAAQPDAPSLDGAPSGPEVSSPEISIPTLSVDDPPRDNSGIAPAASDADVARAALLPMPDAPVGLIPALPYWFKVVLGRFKRSGVIKSYRKEIQAEQAKRNELRTLVGKQVSELQMDHLALLEPMARLGQLLDQRSRLHEEASEVDSRSEEAQQKFDAIAADCNERTAAAQGDVEQTQATLNEKNAQLREIKGELQRVEREIAKLSNALKRKSSALATASDENKRAALEAETESLAEQLQQLEPQQATLQQQSGELEGPVSELTRQLADARTRLREAQQELAAARTDLAASRRTALADKSRKSQETAQLDQQIEECQLQIGTVAEAEGVDHPSLAELRQQLDLLQRAVEHREHAITALETEREAYDRDTSKRGMILALSSIGGALLLIVALIIILVVVL